MLRVLVYALLIPPTSLLLPLALGLAWRRRWLGWGALLILTAFAMPVVPTALNRMVAVGPRPPSVTPPQAIVILSAERRVGAPGGIIEGEDLGPNTVERVRAGIRLARKTGLPMLVSGGVLAPSTPAIAQTIAQVMAREFGAPPKWIEAGSRDTWQNATLSTAMLRADGITSAYLVTASWHMPRAVVAFEHAGLMVTPAPVRGNEPVQLTLEEFTPQARGWIASYYAMHEVIGYAWYRWRSR